MEPYVIAPVKCTFHVSLEAEIPSVTVSKFSLLQHGENIIIFCNVTKGQLAVRTVLKRISFHGLKMECESKLYGTLIWENQTILWGL